jgi:hypothetical protein
MQLESEDAAMTKLTEVKRVKNAVLLTDGENDFIRLDNVRISYPAVGIPENETDDEGNPRFDKRGKQKTRYKLSAMLPKATHVQAKDLCVEVINKLLRKHDVKVAPDKRFISNGDDSDRDTYQGHWIVNAAETRQPPVRDRKGELLMDPDVIDEVIYGGCWGNVLIRPWYFNGKVKGAKKDYPKRIACGLAGVQHAKDDTPFGGGRVNEEDVWETVTEGGDDDDIDL